MTRPSISQIYSAFNMQSHRVFRRAMRDSSGGVLRVNDLVRAIVELDLTPAHPELASPSSVLRPLAPQYSSHVDSSRLVPMSNEPPLRELLERAWDIANSQRPGATNCETTSPTSDDLQHLSSDNAHRPMNHRPVATITPACLAASALIQRGRLPVGQPRESTFEALGLWLPPSLWAPSVRRVGSAESHASPSVMGTLDASNHGSADARSTAMPTEATLIDEALERWLLLQSIQDPEEHTLAVKELTRIVRYIEQSR